MQIALKYRALLASGPDGQSGVHQFQHGREPGKDGSVSDNQFAILIGILAAIFLAILGNRRLTSREEADQKMRRIERELKRERKWRERQEHHREGLKNDHLKNDPVAKNWRLTRAEIAHMKAAEEEGKEGN